VCLPFSWLQACGRGTKSRASAFLQVAATTDSSGVDRNPRRKVTRDGRARAYWPRPIDRLLGLEKESERRFAVLDGGGQRFKWTGPLSSTSRMSARPVLIAIETNGTLVSCRPGSTGSASPVPRPSAAAQARVVEKRAEALSIRQAGAFRPRPTRTVLRRCNFLASSRWMGRTSAANTARGAAYCTEHPYSGAPEP